MCMVGFGTANLLHEHGEVVRTTKLYIIAKVTSSNLNNPGYERRFRRDDGHSTPRGDGYGGTEIYAVCQRAKKKG